MYETTQNILDNNMQFVSVWHIYLNNKYYLIYKTFL